MTHLIIFSLVMTLISCNGFGPRDTSHDTAVNSINELNGLPGTWNATKSVYKMLRGKNYTIDSVRLILHADSTFELTNTPDCINDPAGKSKDQLLESTKGSWTTQIMRNQWMLVMTFDQGKIFESKTRMNFEIRSIDSTLTISYFIGDPDQGDILMFKKETILI